MIAIRPIKTHGGDIYEHLWIIQWGGWGGGGKYKPIMIQLQHAQDSESTRRTQDKYRYMQWFHFACAWFLVKRAIYFMAGRVAMGVTLCAKVLSGNLGNLSQHLIIFSVRNLVGHRYWVVFWNSGSSRSKKDIKRLLGGASTKRRAMEVCQI